MLAGGEQHSGCSHLAVGCACILRDVVHGTHAEATLIDYSDRGAQAGDVIQVRHDWEGYGGGCPDGSCQIRFLRHSPGRFSEQMLC
jgi:hypothetical protein